ncbi:MAG TPA: hypothetical protein VGM74_20320 [Burkholderiaceae bacterium]|jgi:hypothetical protein
MSTVQAVSNPFALLMDPESVLEAVARSERLARLQSRIWRPLDKPLVTARDASTAADDEAVDRAEEAPELLDPFHPLAPL